MATVLTIPTTERQESLVESQVATLLKLPSAEKIGAHKVFSCPTVDTLSSKVSTDDAASLDDTEVDEEDFEDGSEEEESEETIARLSQVVRKLAHSKLAPAVAPVQVPEAIQAADSDSEDDEEVLERLVSTVRRFARTPLQ